MDTITIIITITTTIIFLTLLTLVELYALGLCRCWRRGSLHGGGLGISENQYDDGGDDDNDVGDDDVGVDDDDSEEDLFWKY